MRSALQSGMMALLAASGLAAIPAAASAATVQPVVIDLRTAGQAARQNINVENTSAEQLPVEIKVEELVFEQSGPRAVGPSSDLQVYPPQAVIRPGESQAFRVRWVGDQALSRSKSYYVTVAQVPVALPQGQSGVQILYNFQVLVSVAPNGAKPKLKIESASVGRDSAGGPVPVITVSNDSAAHAYLSRANLRLVARGADGRVVEQRTLSPSELQQTLGYGLVAPGQHRTMTLPISLPAGVSAVEARLVPASR